MRCQQCKDQQFKNDHGSWSSGTAFVRWSVWGCTCDPITLAIKVHQIDYPGTA